MLPLSTLSATYPPRAHQERGAATAAPHVLVPARCSSVELDQLPTDAPNNRRRGGRQAHLNDETHNLVDTDLPHRLGIERDHEARLDWNGSAPIIR